jgi:hypothetical protein
VGPDLRRPAASRYDGPIIDAHCHYGRPAATARMINAGALHGVTKWVGICRIDEVPALRRRFGERAGFSIWLDHKPSSRQTFIDTNLRIIEQAVRRRCQCIKFWYKPEFNQRSGYFFDDPRLDPIFTAIAGADLAVLVHIADPDLWWRSHYRDPEIFEQKRFTYRQLSNTLGRFPEMRVLVAHMGGWPENLPFLTDLLGRYPNCRLDTSATKWIARELSHRPGEARAFMIRHADRLLFGSDLVAFGHADVDHHCSRYWVHRHLYENDHVIKSPIHDPDAHGEVFVAGLNLPDATLRKLYRENAERFFRIEA